jgi:HAMP domain-containing protein
MVKTSLLLAIAVAAAVDPPIPWNVFAFVVSTAVGLYTFATKRSAARQADLHRIEQDVAVISERMKHLPTRDEVAELDGAIRELCTELRGTNKLLARVEARQDLQDGWLHSQGGAT